MHVRLSLNPIGDTTMPRNALPSCGLYALTDGPRSDLLEVSAQALAGGARLLQYRDNGADEVRRLAEAAALKKLCVRHAALLIVETDVDLAMAVQADGVHLHRVEELPPARARLGDDAIIGLSCRDSIALAKAAAGAGASYVSFGAFFPSPTKPLAPRASIDLLRQSAALGIPRVAIGGITPDNGASLVAEGAQFLAVISALFGAADVRLAAQRLAHLYSPTSGTAA